MRQHTPGPWSVQRVGDGSGSIHIYATESMDDIVTRRVGVKDDANARLIAAAPDLLEELIKCVAMMAEVFDIPEESGLVQDTYNDAIATLKALETGL